MARGGSGGGPVTTIPPGIDPDLYLRALTDVRSLRAYGTYRTAPERKSPTDGPDCGTRRGYTRHRRDGENACPGCLDANAGADRRLRETGTSREVSG